MSQSSPIHSTPSHPTSFRSAKIFSGDQPCQCGVKNHRFRDLFRLHHQARPIARDDFSTFIRHESLYWFLYSGSQPSCQHIFPVNNMQHFRQLRKEYPVCKYSAVVFFFTISGLIICCLRTIFLKYVFIQGNMKGWNWSSKRRLWALEFLGLNNIYFHESIIVILYLSVLPHVSSRTKTGTRYK
jgi:hypothetical protein